MTNQSAPNYPNFINTGAEESSPEKKSLSRKQKMVMAIAGVALALVAAVGIGSNVGTTKEKESLKVNAPIESELKAELSTSEKKYADYLKTLSPEQVALRESLNPDALAEMSDSEIAEAFTISSDEVMIDGKIDPKLYKEAFTARFQAMSNSGISKIEYEKRGGLDNFGTDTIDEVSKRYFDIQSNALFGYIGTKKISYTSLSKGAAVDRIIKGNLSPQPKERYSLRIVAKTNPTEFIEKGNGIYDIRFSAYLSDNWEKEIIYKRSGVLIEPTDGNLTWDINGIHVTKDGYVQIRSITTN